MLTYTRNARLRIILSFLLAVQVVLVDIELIADVLQQVCVLHQIVDPLEAMRLCKGSGILHRDVDLQVSQVRAAEPLDYVQLVRMRNALPREPSFIVEADGV